MPALHSMTGYARAAVSTAEGEVACELKTVNARGLDMRLRLAPGLDALEPELRRRLSAALSRGAVSLVVTLEGRGAGGGIAINEQALAQVLEALEALSLRVEAAPPRLDGILAIKGVVVEQRDQTPDGEEEDRREAVFAALDTALGDLLAARAVEGAALRMSLDSRLDEIAALAARIEAHPARSREALLERLRGQLADLQQAAPNGLPVAEDRLAQEILLLATKADIREELDRLAAHVSAARALLAGGGPVGRKLDFLSQEFNREANTLCAKVNAVELTAIGLDLKAVIDQFREQVQNIE